MADSSVLVVGGGLAGITTALRCADAGRGVTLVEGRPRLGGAAFSFRRGDLTIDNGQHVFLRCCEAYQWFVDRVGARDKTTLQPRLDIPVLRADGRSARLRRTACVLAPAHLSAALARYGLLSPLDRARAVRGAIALKLLDPTDPRLDARTLGDYLRAHGQPPAVIDALWGIVAVATLNIDPDEASLALAAKVFRTGLLDRADAADVGYAAAPLGDLHSVAARRALDAAGVEVLLGHRVESVTPGGGDAVLRHRDERVTRRAEAVVLAVPPREAFTVLPELADTAAGSARELGTSPIVNVHVVFDRRVTDLPFAAGVDSPVQWIFDRTDTSGLTSVRPGAQYLAITISSADAIIDTPSAALTERFVAELRRLLPAARQAEVVDTFVTRERHATFRQAAGTARLRPGPVSALDGVWLAGAWTATGWPDTMESAVRSGIAAADSVLRVAERDAMRFAS
ncbi:MAG: FAD-dependent oxidoreductase [Actinobacteria bacterium]|nr:FAD-dependent oxidoreductase [Actinomycetota bacterium]